MARSRHVNVGVGPSQKRFTFESQLSSGGLHELCAKLPLAGRQGRGLRVVA